MSCQIFNAIYVLVRNFPADQNGGLGEQIALTLVEICVYFKICVKLAIMYCGARRVKQCNS